MNDEQRWTLIEALFDQIAKQCAEIMRLIEDHEADEWCANHPSYARWPISNGEAGKLLEDAKRYLENGNE